MSKKNPKSRMAVLPPEETGGRPVKIWAVEYSDELGRYIPAIGENTRLQVGMVARLPCAHGHIALMPDAHYGKGVPIGCVLPTKGAIIPNAVGVDIGCGMCAWNSGVLANDLDVRKLMVEWKELIPHGEGKSHSGKADVLSEPKFKKAADELAQRHAVMADEHGKFEAPPDFERFRCQLGTLGGGNHFVELQKDSSGIAWIMIHSGSRGYGAQTAKQHHNAAKAICSRYFSKLETQDLAYLPIDCAEGQYYIEAMQIAQDFAYQNRAAMMRAAQSALRDQVHQTNPLADFINIHHNYAAQENHGGENVWVHRKGATLARPQTIGIIPGSMTTKSYIVKGKGNKDSMNSCSHGSGRNFSRTEAKRRVKEGVDPSQESQLGKANVELYGTRNAHDELGTAYKDVGAVMENQADLVDIETELKPIAVLKG
tara:strand:- start:20555 stop:21835 length:1281 start_codon:yes stop_codon:yes gene_type:complete